jgi:hypothetical protein
MVAAGFLFQGPRMIGRKKLSTVRQEIAKALSATGKDPIQWLEDELAKCPDRKGSDAETLRSLQRLLGEHQKPAHSQTRSPAKRVRSKGKG